MHRKDLVRRGYGKSRVTKQEGGGEWRGFERGEAG